MRTIALVVYDQLRAGRFDELAELFTPEMRAVVAPETVRVAWTVQTAGAPTEPGDPAAEETDQGLLRVRLPVRCPTGDFVIVLSHDESGRLHGLRLAPAAGAPWQPPRYARPFRFTECETSAGVLSLPNKTPNTTSRGQAVILLPGGGQQDRDGTDGPHKPLKDLAWGLAGRGIAVLRFDKPPPERTLTEEYVAPALAAVRQLREQRPAVDPDRIFLLGHSLGGKVAPRVAAAEPAIAGLILLAAEAMPTHRSAQRVARQLAARDPGPASAAMLAAVDRQVAVVDDALTAETPAADLPFGFPASYWLDLRDYDPVRTAAALRRPMLILQGGRDRQVTVADDLARWRAGLGARRDVRIRVLRGLDHMFYRGGHVHPAVVRKIARWLLARRATGK
ncbi:pimeloyl-ACP methyl ester carboxylesterase [Actinoplanes octamycinicus]|uniref:Pimeloyl-ACP methyl ester carboxylesterase n=1 Tax=Actinoplanes octamycinicus TaxID=135948 RepID=A0A7W7H614_9ACTN|nr:alpha/beta hydrolase [Actinoplanes octamycinicus]MBB4744671.1 pimeloyl-ACP methyl ester carboxylesterase [Actinoplanes octamycinicus]GIE55252.1 hypothetical protein Aoc01nite_06540 [Actinoplanes octamycinicus]